jgi:hypothetical protein
VVPVLEIATRMPAVKLFVALKVTTLPLVDKEWIPAAELHAPLHAPKGAGMSVTSVSGELLPVEIVFVPVTTSAMTPASQTLTYTWLLSDAAVVYIRKRMVPGAYVAAGAQPATEVTANCVAAKLGVLSKEIEGARNEAVTGLTAILGASKTVSSGMMQLALLPTFGSLHLASFW